MSLKSHWYLLGLLLCASGCLDGFTTVESLRDEGTSPGVPGPDQGGASAKNERSPLGMKPTKLGSLGIGSGSVALPNVSPGDPSVMELQAEKAPGVRKSP